METLSELQRENRELNERKELLELRHENRMLKKEIELLQAGKQKKERGPFMEMVMYSPVFFIVTTIAGIFGGIALGEVLLSLKAIAGR